MIIQKTSAVLLDRTQLIDDHGDEFRVGGLAPLDVDRVAEEFVHHLYIAPVPGQLDGMADRPFHPAGGGPVSLHYWGL